MGQILLVRHAQAAFGSADYDRLSELGREQARLLGAWLASRGRRIDLVVTGGLRRHRETAEACLALLPDALAPVDPWRREPDFDEYDADEIVVRHQPHFADRSVLQLHLDADGHPGRAFHELFSAAMTRWMQGSHDADYSESWQGFCARCVAALKRLTEEAGPSRTSIVFTSGGPIAGICQYLLELPTQRTLDLNLSLVNCAVTGLLYQRSRISVSYINNFAYLEQVGETRLVSYR